MSESYNIDKILALEDSKKIKEQRLQELQEEEKALVRIEQD